MTSRSFERVPSLKLCAVRVSGRQHLHHAFVLLGNSNCGQHAKTNILGETRKPNQLMQPWGFLVDEFERRGYRGTKTRLVIIMVPWTCSTFSGRALNTHGHCSRLQLIILVTFLTPRQRKKTIALCRRGILTLLCPRTFLGGFDHHQRKEKERFNSKLVQRVAGPLSCLLSRLGLLHSASERNLSIICYPTDSMAGDWTDCDAVILKVVWGTEWALLSSFARYVLFVVSGSKRTMTK